MPTTKQHRSGLKGREFSSNNVVENIHTSSQLDVIPGARRYFLRVQTLEKLSLTMAPSSSPLCYGSSPGSSSTLVRLSC